MKFLTQSMLDNIRKVFTFFFEVCLIKFAILRHQVIRKTECETLLAFLPKRFAYYHKVHYFFIVLFISTISAITDVPSMLSIETVTSHDSYVLNWPTWELRPKPFHSERPVASTGTYMGRGGNDNEKCDTLLQMKNVYCERTSRDTLRH